jgi:hypothetical protein
MQNLFLILSTILLGIVFIASVYERAVNMPKWFADPPASFRLIKERAPKAQRFWIPLQGLFLISFIIAFILNWELTDVRNYMIVPLVVYVIIIISTAAYFAREIIFFTKIPKKTPAIPELINRADRWKTLTTLRNFLLLIGFIFLLLAIIK